VSSLDPSQAVFPRDRPITPGQAAENALIEK
jgi:hypothetical protein